MSQVAYLHISPYAWLGGLSIFVYFGKLFALSGAIQSIL